MRPERMPRRIADQVLPHLDPDIGDAIRLGVAVHRRVEQLARIGKLVADDQPLVAERRDRPDLRAVR